MTDFNRRKILQAGGAALTLGLAGCLADGEGVPGTAPERTPTEGGNGNGAGGAEGRVDDFLTEMEANLYEGEIADHTGEDSVTVEVGAGGGLAFDEPAIQIDPGTTVTWEWTGEGGNHNVAPVEDSDFSDFGDEETYQEGGTTVESTFDEEGVGLYVCEPHRTVGMAGAIIVGSGGGGGASPEAQVDEFLTEMEANLYEGEVEDLTGQDEVTIEVGAGGGLAFDPPAAQIDPGTTVIWEWTGEGGNHNVVPVEDSPLSEFGDTETYSEAGTTVEHTFEEAGIGLYVCQPHETVGMAGAIIVGDGGGGGGSDADAQVDEFLTEMEANLYEGEIEDLTGEDSVTVEVGAGEGLAFGPPAIRIDAGTTVTWEWTGNGGAHNVAPVDDSPLSDFGDTQTYQEAGTTVESTFDEGGVGLYVCEPHRTLGMAGAIIVEGGTEGMGDEEDMGDDEGDMDDEEDDMDMGGGDADAFLSDNDANLYDGSVEDLTGEDSVTVEVGAGSNGFAFAPPAIRIDSGTTVTWEWTGQGGGHNVVPADESELTGFGSEEIVSEEGHTVESTFDGSGTGLYMCQPHISLGMVGAVIVE